MKPKRQLFIVVPKLSLGMKILHDCEKICTTQQFLLEIRLHSVWSISKATNDNLIAYFRVPKVSQIS